MRVFSFFLKLAVAGGFCVAVAVGVFQWARHGRLVPDAFVTDARLLLVTARGFFSQFSAASQERVSPDPALPQSEELARQLWPVAWPASEVSRIRTLVREATSKIRELDNELAEAKQMLEGGRIGPGSAATNQPSEPSLPPRPALPVEVVVTASSAPSGSLRPVEPDFASMLRQVSETRERLAKGGAL